MLALDRGAAGHGILIDAGQSVEFREDRNDRAARSIAGDESGRDVGNARFDREARITQFRLQKAR